MKNLDLNESYFNGKLHSLKFLCNKYGLDKFSMEYGFILNRVQKLYNSELTGNHNIENVLLSDNFEKDYEELLDKNLFLENLDKNYCGIGLLNVKSLLFKLATTNIVAETILFALQIEEVNVLAKKSIDNDLFYQQKERLILSLIEICEKENINYGFGNSDVEDIPFVIYFDLACGQLSWHTKLDKQNYKTYNGSWDGVKFGTFYKIEKFIKENYL